MQFPEAATLLTTTLIINNNLLYTVHTVRRDKRWIMLITTIHRGYNVVRSWCCCLTPPLSSGDSRRPSVISSPGLGCPIKAARVTPSLCLSQQQQQPFFFATLCFVYLVSRTWMFVSDHSQKFRLCLTQKSILVETPSAYVTASVAHFVPQLSCFLGHRK